MKAWQHDYPLADLRAAADLFAQHDAGIALGPFTQVNPRTVADWLHRGELELVGDQRRPCAAIVTTTRVVSGALNDFAGPLLTLPAGLRQIKRVAWLDRGGSDIVAERIQSCVATGGLVYLWQEHGAQRRLARTLGLRLLAARVASSAEIIGIYGREPQTAVERDRFETADRLRPPIEHVSAARLACETLDVGPLADRLDDVGHWKRHYSNYNVGGTWQAVALRGFGGSVNFIEKPSEMKRSWKIAHPTECAYTVSDTPLRALLADVADPIIEAFPGVKQRVRLMRLEPGGGRLDRHTDIGDPESGTRDGEVMRLHVPIVTNPDARFQFWTTAGTRIDATMAVGEPWYLDTRKPHAAWNAGDGPRVHLVVDVHASPALRALVPTG